MISFYDIAFYFIIYAFLGWCLEVVFCSIDTGKFVNRGFLNGPLCPIYGFGACIVIPLLTPIADNLILLYIGSVILTSLLELVGGWLLNVAFHTRWWDYSDQPFNIGGYICLKFSLLWGIACIFLFKVIHPAIAGLVSIVPQMVGIIFLAIAYLLLFVDLGLTVAVVAKLNRDLGEITKLAQGLHKSSDLLAEGLGNTALSVAQKIDDLDLETQKQQLTEKWDVQKSKWEESVKSTKEMISSSIEENVLMQKLEEIRSENHWLRNRLLRAFPNMRSERYAEALRHLRNVTLGKKEEDAQDASDDLSNKDGD